MVVCAVKLLRRLRRSKFILLAQEFGADSQGYNS